MEKEIYFAGGCFWGVQEYFSRLKGVIQTSVGYANGTSANPSYHDLKQGLADHAETAYIRYDDNVISLEKLLEHYLRFVDPYSVNRQGHDEGLQYRSGIYYLDEKDKEIVLHYFNEHLEKNYAIQVEKLRNYYLAEEYHQDYLKKNLDGYCHVNLNLIKENEKK